MVEYDKRTPTSATG